MKLSDLTEFEIEEEGFKLRICRGKPEQTTVVTTATPAPFPAYIETSSVTPRTAPPEAESAEEEGEEDQSVEQINSPMVGTFYRSPSPDSAHFVEEGSEVSDDTIVCIIEAMKVMNEIQAETTGVITEIMVENGQSVEFGQPLFKVKMQ